MYLSLQLFAALNMQRLSLNVSKIFFMSYCIFRRPIFDVLIYYILE